MTVTSYDYYKRFPSSDHEPGDLWQNIPVRGLGKIKSAHAIVVTPSCDLAQGKSEVINLIPVIPVSDYFFSRAFYYEAWNGVKGIFESTGGLKLDGRFGLPRLDDIQSIIDLLNPKKEIAKITKCESYKGYVKYAMGLSEHKPSIGDIIGGTNYNNILDKIIRNGYKSDIHFLPATRLGEEYGLASHSVAMFRYVFSIDISILDRSQITQPEDWKDVVSEGRDHQIDFTGFDAFPVKIGKLKNDFLSDFLSRHLNMHMRFGSRDFSSAYINTIKGEI